MAQYLRVAESEDHRALSDARLVMGVFQRIVSRSRRLKTVGDLFRILEARGESYWLGQATRIGNHTAVESPDTARVSEV